MTLEEKLQEILGANYKESPAYKEFLKKFQNSGLPAVGPDTSTRASVGEYATLGAEGLALGATEPFIGLGEDIAEGLGSGDLHYRRDFRKNFEDRKDKMLYEGANPVAVALTSGLSQATGGLLPAGKALGVTAKAVEGGSKAVQILKTVGLGAAEGGLYGLGGSTDESPEDRKAATAGGMALGGGLAGLVKAKDLEIGVKIPGLGFLDKAKKAPDVAPKPNSKGSLAEDFDASTKATLTTIEESRKKLEQQSIEKRFATYSQMIAQMEDDGMGDAARVAAHSLARDYEAAHGYLVESPNLTPDGITLSASTILQAAKDRVEGYKISDEAYSQMLRDSAESLGTTEKVNEAETILRAYKDGHVTQVEAQAALGTGVDKKILDGVVSGNVTTQEAAEALSPIFGRSTAALVLNDLKKGNITRGEATAILGGADPAVLEAVKGGHITVKEAAELLGARDKQVASRKKLVDAAEAGKAKVNQFSEFSGERTVDLGSESKEPWLKTGKTVSVHAWPEDVPPTKTNVLASIGMDPSVDNPRIVYIRNADGKIVETNVRLNVLNSSANEGAETTRLIKIKGEIIDDGDKAALLLREAPPIPEKARPDLRTAEGAAEAVFNLRNEAAKSGDTQAFDELDNWYRRNFADNGPDDTVQNSQPSVDAATEMLINSIPEKQRGAKSLTFKFFKDNIKEVLTNPEKHAGFRLVTRMLNIDDKFDEAVKMASVGQPSEVSDPKYLRSRGVGEALSTALDAINHVSETVFRVTAEKKFNQRLRAGELQVPEGVDPSKFKNEFIELYVKDKIAKMFGRLSEARKSGDPILIAEEADRITGKALKMIGGDGSQIGYRGDSLETSLRMRDAGAVWLARNSGGKSIYDMGPEELTALARRVGDEGGSPFALDVIEGEISRRTSGAKVPKRPIGEQSIGEMIRQYDASTEKIPTETPHAGASASPASSARKQVTEPALIRRGYDADDMVRLGDASFAEPQVRFDPELRAPYSVTTSVKRAYEEGGLGFLINVGRRVRDYVLNQFSSDRPMSQNWFSAFVQQGVHRWSNLQAISMRIENPEIRAKFKESVRESMTGRNNDFNATLRRGRIVTRNLRAAAKEVAKAQGHSDTNKVLREAFWMYKRGELNNITDPSLRGLILEQVRPLMNETAQRVLETQDDPSVRQTILDNMETYLFDRMNIFNKKNRFHARLRGFQKDSEAYKGFRRNIEARDHDVLFDQFYSEVSEPMRRSGASEDDIFKAVEVQVQSMIDQVTATTAFDSLPYGEGLVEGRVGVALASPTEDYLKQQKLKDENLKKLFGREENLASVVDNFYTAVAADTRRMAIKEGIANSMKEAGLLVEAMSATDETGRAINAMADDTKNILISDRTWKKVGNDYHPEAGEKLYATDQIFADFLTGVDHGQSAIGKNLNMLISMYKLGFVATGRMMAVQAYGAFQAPLMSRGLWGAVKGTTGLVKDVALLPFTKDVTSSSGVALGAALESLFPGMIKHPKIRAIADEIVARGLDSGDEMVYDMLNANDPILKDAGIGREPASKFQRFGRKFIGRAGDFIRAADLQTKIFTYMDNVESVAWKNGVDLEGGDVASRVLNAPEWIKNQATKHTLMTTQDSRATINLLRNMNVGATGTLTANFLGYQYQIARAAYHSNWTIAKADLMRGIELVGKGNKELGARHIGAALNRWMGAAVAVAGTYAYFESRNSDQDDAMHTFLPDYSKYSHVSMDEMKKNKDGSLTSKYFDTGNVDMYGGWAKLARATQASIATGDWSQLGNEFSSQADFFGGLLGAVGAFAGYEFDTNLNKFMDADRFKVAETGDKNSIDYGRRAALIATRGVPVVGQLIKHGIGLADAILPGDSPYKTTLESVIWNQVGVAVRNLDVGKSIGYHINGVVDKHWSTLNQINHEWDKSKTIEQEQYLKKSKSADFDQFMKELTFMRDQAIGSGVEQADFVRIITSKYKTDDKEFKMRTILKNPAIQRALIYKYKITLNDYLTSRKKRLEEGD